MTIRVLALLKNNKTAIDIGEAGAADIDAVVALDAEITGTAKPEYWSDILKRYTGSNQHMKRYFLVARSEKDGLTGFVVGEVRAWEFGSPPCGWVFALSVRSENREQGIGNLLFEALCTEMKKDGVDTIRTMVLGTDKINLSFFRGEGLASGPYVELERRLD